MLDLTKGVVAFSTELPGLGNPITDVADVLAVSAEVRVDWYEELLAYSLLRRAMQRDNTVSGIHQEKIFPYIKHILTWVRSTDFYTAPASIKWHEAYIGGLLVHTLKAYVQLCGLRQVPKFRSVVDDQWWSAVFAILTHDWCKIGRYEQYLKNIPPDDECPDWHQEYAYRTKDDDVVRFGHGPQSLIVAMQLCGSSKLTSLTFEEMAAIRWHMDGWDIGHYDDKDLAKCNEKIPMVRMIQFADLLAITSY